MEIKYCTPDEYREKMRDCGLSNPTLKSMRLIDYIYSDCGAFKWACDWNHDDK